MPARSQPPPPANSGQDDERRIGEALEARRRQLGIRTQTEAALRIGVVKSVYSRWVSSTTPTLPSLDNVDAIAKFLDCARSDVLALYPAQYDYRTRAGSRTAQERIDALATEVRELRIVVEGLSETVERLLST